MTKNKIFSLIFICTLLLQSGCKTTKEMKGSMKSYGAEELFSLVVNNTLEYQTFSGKMTTALRTGKTDLDVSTHLKIIKNEKLQLSFQVPLLGEMFRLAVSKDSLILIDRMNKRFLAESIYEMKQTSSFDFDLHNLQALFTNQLFLAGKSAITTKDFQLFTVNREKEQALITTKDKYMDYTFTVDYTDHIRNSLLTGNSGKTAMSWSYNNFTLLENKCLFPMQMGMNLNSGTNKLSLNFTFSKIDLNKEVEIDFSIPKKYNRITQNQILTLLFKNLFEN